MTAGSFLRYALLSGAGFWLTACGDAVVVEFTQPFPAWGQSMSVFPTRYRAVYTASDSVTSLCISPTAMWRQQLRHVTFGRKTLDSLGHPLRADSTYRDDSGRLHYLRLVGRDSVRDSWLNLDTVFTLSGPQVGHLRRFQGRYYLSTPTSSAETWEVQRLEISGQQLLWQTMGADTLRLLALDTATVRHRHANGVSYYRLAPHSRAQAAQLSRYAGLWQTEGEFRRRH